MQNRRLWVTGLALAGLVAGSTAPAAPKNASVRKPVSRTPAKSAARTPAKPAASAKSLPQIENKANKIAVVPKNVAEPVYSVVSPLGDSAVKMITMAPRLNTLKGKTVGLIWNQAFKADVTLPAIEKSLKEKYPDIKIVPYTEIDAAIRVADREDSSTEAEILQAVLKEKGCDAVISGNGG